MCLFWAACKFQHNRIFHNIQAKCLQKSSTKMSVVIETTQGDLTVDLYLKERPKTCLNFLKLCKTKAYNLNLFHTVQNDFIAQTGDPSGTGRGGESVFSQLYGEQVQ